MLYSTMLNFGSSESSSGLFFTAVQNQKYISQHAVYFVNEISLIYGYLLQ